MAEKSVMMVSPKAGMHTSDSELIIATCGCEAWISQTGLAMLKEHPEVETVCMICADPKAFAESIRKHGLLAPPGSRAEILKELPGDQAIARIAMLMKEMSPDE